ncbi:MAG TPA: ATP-binding protein [Candidatus Krumholzibacteria bacterium]|nr:ATP-binding protein [Candidatus Krumholzibacteria bacterium]HPD70937.1 ATP-binding protein [Candidatus Krumholzibacteria bacterium]HRY39363.1 ATP-binding protein [Candidatus Krumholzibacteria bacterium]
MKIAFMGTHGVGKTTLCYDLAASLKRLDLSVDLVKEVARRCPLPINRETTRAAQQWILHTQIAEEIALEPSFDYIVCDRAVLDNYAYLVNAIGRQPELEDLVRHWMRTYHLLVKVPVVAPPSFDGTRDVSVAFQRAVDQVIDKLLADYRLACLRLPPTDRSGWVPAVIDALALPRRAPQLDLF